MTKNGNMLKTAEAEGMKSTLPVLIIFISLPISVSL